MGIPILGDIIDAVKDIVGEVVVDKDKKNEINYKLAELADKAEARVHEEVLAQIEVNKVEAASGSLFVAGWRPFVGWVGGAGLAYSAIVQPFASWIARLSGYTGDFPPIDNMLLLTVLGGLLGIGGMRTFEKVRGVSTNNYTDTPKETPVVTEATPGPEPARRQRKFRL